MRTSPSAPSTPRPACVLNLCVFMHPCTSYQAAPVVGLMALLQACFIMRNLANLWHGDKASYPFNNLGSIDVTETTQSTGIPLILANGRSQGSFSMA